METGLDELVEEQLRKYHILESDYKLEIRNLRIDILNAEKKIKKNALMVSKWEAISKIVKGKSGKRK